MRKPHCPICADTIRQFECRGDGIVKIIPCLHFMDNYTIQHQIRYINHTLTYPTGEYYSLDALEKLYEALNTSGVLE